MKILITCPCGDEFETTQNRIDAGRGKYCSRACMYKYRTRPSGLKYNIKVENEAWFKPGDKPWNDGVPQPHLHKQDPGYDAIHEWIQRWGKANACEFCGSTDDLQWSNKSGEYKRDLSDWQRLCRSCHVRYDYENFGVREWLYQ